MSLFSDEARRQLDREALERRIKAAYALLELQPNYPSVRISIYERRQQIQEQLSKPGEIRSQVLLDNLFLGFEIFADACLPLVNDLETQKAYELVITAEAEKVWRGFSGLPSDFQVPAGPLRDAYDKTLARAAHWITEGFRRLASMVPAQHPAESKATTRQPQSRTVPPTEAPSSDPSAVRTFLEPKMALLKNLDSRLNRKNAAQAVGFSQRHFDRMVKAGDIVPVTLGHRKLFKARDLLRILNQKTRDKVDKSGQ